MFYQVKTSGKKVDSGYYIILIDDQQEETNTVNYLNIITNLSQKKEYKLLYQPILNKHLSKCESASDYGIWISPGSDPNEITSLIEKIPFKYKMIKIDEKNNNFQSCI